MKLKGIKHIFFDLDHTLWDFDKNSSLTFQKIFGLHNVDINHEHFVKAYEPINLNYWKLYREEKINKENLRYQRLKDTFDALNVFVEDALIDKLSSDYVVHLSSFTHLFEGTFELLDYLKPNYELHIITNGFDEAQHKKMNNSKIAPYFKTMTNAEIAGVKKPDPIIFNYALELAKASPGESIMIGDNYEADILGAKALGLEVILFNYHNSVVEANIKQVKLLQELRQYL
jgi:putative hydrolase of the HAD superfamily